MFVMKIHPYAIQFNCEYPDLFQNKLALIRTLNVLFA